MLRLSNGARVICAYIQPASSGVKPNGIVLAETETDWVVWSIHWDGEWEDDEDPDDTGPVAHELWQADGGDYHQKSQSGKLNVRMAAEFQFGLKLKRLLQESMLKGIRG